MGTETADLEIVCPGMLAGTLEVLAIGKGHLTLTVGGDDPAEVARARKVIDEMLRAGYSIFVETDRGPVRVKRFNPKRMTYLISDVPEEEPGGKATAAAKPRKDPGRKPRDRQVPVAGSHATAVGRTAGG